MIPINNGKFILKLLIFKRCHRFDQDALTLVNTFFYGHPIDYDMYQPPYAFRSGEKFFFEINRRNIKKYIQDQINNLFN